MEDLSFLDAVASTGCVISLAHKAAMQSSFPLLKKQNKFSKVMFFGKVMGKVGDYLIAVGIEESFLAGKKFFFCTDGVTWAQLPAPTDADAALAAKLPNGLPFTGDISHEFPTPPEPPPPVAEGEEPPEEVEPPKLPEIMRLAVLVNMLDAENAIAPAGALCMLSTGAVKENTAYAGAPPRPTRARRLARAQPWRPAALPRPAAPCRPTHAAVVRRRSLLRLRGQHKLVCLRQPAEGQGCAAALDD